MLDYVSSKGYFKKVNFTKDHTPLYPVFSLRKALRELLHNMGVPFNDPCCDSTQVLTGPGAVSLDTYSTILVTTGANALTLADGTEGQQKFIKMRTDGGNGTLTPAHLQGGTTLQFNDAGDFVNLLFSDGKWNILTNSGVTLA